jgi:hypothetical protein
MSCCGKGRANLRAVMSPDVHRASSPMSSGYGLVVYFECVGSARLIARGPISGRIYEFSGPGARLEVDSRDRHALRRSPNW